MYIFKIHGKEYKVRFTYRMICKGDLLDKVLSIGDFDDTSPNDIVNRLATITIELLLAGLQKYHKDEFGYDTDAEKEQRIDEMFDLLDDYEDESTEEHKQSAVTLFNDLQAELESNGFLSAMMQSAETQTEVETKADEAMKEVTEKPARVVAMDTDLSAKKS